jgi:hypothetical protein
MDKQVQITSIIVAGVLILGLLAYLTFVQLSPPSNTIDITGQSSIDVIPDIVGIYFNVQTQAETSAEAGTKNSEIIENLKTALIQKGFDQDEIQTQSFNINPNYDYNNGRKITGYTASHRIRVEFSAEDTDRIGKTIDAGVEAGAGINYIAFELTQDLQNQYKAQAIAQASEDARIKAESIAKGLGKNLGELVSVSDNVFDYRPFGLYEASNGFIAEEAKAATTNIQPSEQTISASVRAVFKIR